MVAQRVAEPVELVCHLGQLARHRFARRLQGVRLRLRLVLRGLLLQLREIASQRVDTDLSLHPRRGLAFEAALLFAQRRTRLLRRPASCAPRPARAFRTPARPST
jgi:hypothetical protein